MKIGIIGSGFIGGTCARLFAAHGHEVAIANSRGPESLEELVGELGAGGRAETVEGASDFGDLMLLAVPLASYTGLPADRLTGKIVVDANNYYPSRDGQIAELDSDATTSTELIGRHLEGARMVKAFNSMHYATLAAEGKPGAPRDERLALFVASDDAEAKRLVSDLIEEIGFAAVDTGSLAEGGRRQQPGTPVYNTPMTAPEAEAALLG